MPDAKDNALSADPVALLAKLEADHGPEIAAVAFRAITGQDPPRRRADLVNSRVSAKRGSKPKKPIPLNPQKLLRETTAGKNVPWVERGQVVGFRDTYHGPRNRSGLPTSGAPRA